MATNEGILRARGKYITYLDDDDFIYPDHLQTLVQSIQKSPCPFVYTNTKAVVGKLDNGRFVQTHVSFLWDQNFNRDMMI